MKYGFLLIHFFLFIQFQFLFAGTQYYRLSYRDDPSTTIVVGWCDDGTSTNAQVHYGTTDYGTDYQSYLFTHGIDRTVNYKGLNHQFARLSGLTSNTVYYFVVHDDNGTSARMIFKTLPDNANTPITFIAGGDSRTGIIGEFEYSQCRTRRQDINSLVAKIRPSFIAFSGDYVFSIPDIYIPSTNSAWADWFADWQFTITPDGQLIPLMPTFGNHELTDDVSSMFDVPNNNTYYSLGVGGKLLRIYTLNTEIGCDADQQNWLANDLQLHTGNTNEPYWKFVQYHYPFVPHAYYAPNTAISACWASLFENNKVRLVAESHTHTIKYTWPIVSSTATGSDNGFTRNDTTGIVYIGEGSWGAPMRDLYTYYSADAAFNWTRNQEKMPGIQIVCVTKQKIEVRTAKSDNVGTVGQVQMNDPPCSMPANITLWNPGNGGIITINNPPLSTDALLINLTTSEGTLNPAFAQTTANYTVILPAGTTTVPTVSATVSNPNATLQITQAASLTGSVSERTATVVVTAEDGITTMVYSVLFSIDNTGINEIIAGRFAVVYPNPGKDTFYFDFFNKHQQIELKVYNALGKHIRTEKIATDNIYSLDLSSEAKGVYYIYIKKEKLHDTFKVTLLK
ncbi:MAG: T9SS type A sorting domain-containing protein [Bacteroidia bacterium]|nr:T9SS type A sorting domain-containing protein [Bacteroidia bacterium]